MPDREREEAASERPREPGFACEATVVSTPPCRPPGSFFRTVDNRMVCDDGTVLVAVVLPDGRIGFPDLCPECLSMPLTNGAKECERCTAKADAEEEEGRREAARQQRREARERRRWYR